MDVCLEQRQETVYVMLSGEADNSDMRESMRRAGDLLKNGPAVAEVVFDLSNVTTVTGAMIGKFLMFHRRLATAGKRMRIQGLHENIVPHFELLRLDQLFPVDR